MPNLTCCYAIFYYHCRQGIISTWKHYFGWLDTLRNISFQSSGRSSRLSPLMGFFHIVSRSGRGDLRPPPPPHTHTPENLPFCCCYYILLRKMFLKLLHWKSLSKPENMGCLNSCQNLQFPLAGEWLIQLWFVHTMEHYSTISVYTCNKSLGESSENYAERTKPIPKGYILCHSIYITFQKWQNGWNGDQISGCLRLRRE